MLELKLTVTDAAKVAAILMILQGPDGVAGTNAPAHQPEPAAAPKERKTKDNKVTEMPAPAPAASEAASESPADLRKRLTPKIVALAQTADGVARVKALWAELGVGKFSEVPDDKLAGLEAKLA